MQRSKFGGIQAGRAVAAILVVFSHASTIIAEPRFYGTEPFGGLLRGFGAGVDFFFVLSGFIIAWVHWGDIGRQGRVGPYARNRFLRIYPPYWGILLPLSLLYFLFPNTGQPSQHDPMNFVFSLLLAPYPEHPILGVAWTLVHEVIFYIVFGLLIRLGSRAVWMLPAWGAMIVVLQLSFERLPFPLTILFNEFNLEFLLGVGSALWLMRRKTLAPGTLAVGGALVFLLTMMLGKTIYDHSLAARMIFGLSSAAFILGTVELERANRLAVPHFTLLLGGASYAIYLIHGVTLSASVNILTRWFGPTLPLGPLVCLLVVVSTVVGVAYHLAVERPLGEALRRSLQLLPRF
ncbi:acyltransferase family protein [Methylobacterium sp. CM6247]